MMFDKRKGINVMNFEYDYETAEDREDADGKLFDQDDWSVLLILAGAWGVYITFLLCFVLVRAGHP